MKKYLFCPLAALLCATCLLLGAQSTALAQTWEPMGPGGGSFAHVVTDPANPDVVTSISTYPSAANVYHSTDGGANWAKIGELPDYYLYDVCAYDMSRIYALGFSSVFYTSDGGATWGSSTLPAGYGYCLCAHPTDPNKVYGAGYQYVSGAYQLKYYYSTDAGQTWNVDNIGFGFKLPYGMAISKTNPDVMYIAGYQQISGGYSALMYKTEDAGGRWMNISANVETDNNFYLYSVAVDPADENIVYAGGGRFYRSTDGGATWAKDTSHAFGAEAIGIDPVTPANLYVGGSNAVYVSTDYAQTWTKHQGVVYGYPSQVEVSPSTPSTVHISSTYGGLFKTTDSGATWGTAHGGINACGIPALAVAPSMPEMVFIDISAASTVMVSYDCACNWELKTYPEGCSGTINELLIKSDDPNTIIALEAG